MAHAIAAACVGQASLVIDAKPSTHRGWREGIRPGFKPDLSNAVATAPGRWRDVVDLPALRKSLRRDNRCANTKLVSPACAVQWSRSSAGVCLLGPVRGVQIMSPTRRSGQPLCRKGAGPGGICDLQKIKKFLEAKKMVPPASIVRRWVPRDHSVNLDEPYIAVHLNLDCDSPRPKLRLRSRPPLTRL